MSLRAFIFTVLFCGAPSAFSQTAGTYNYNTTTNSFEFFNGVDWITSNNGTTGLACTQTGSMRYNSTDNRQEFCNGTNWRTMLGANIGSSCSIVGALDYLSSSNLFRVCVGATNTWWSVAEVDSSMSSVVLLMHGEGTNGSQTYTDSSPYGHTFTVTGGTVVNTTIRKMGSGSLYNPGTSTNAANIIRSPTSSAFTLTGNFTVEAWAYPISVTDTYAMFMSRSGADNSSGGFQLGAQSTGPRWNFTVHDGSYKSIVSDGLLTTGQWTHIAVDRSGTTLRLYVNGQVQSTTTTSSGSFMGTQIELFTGHALADNGDWNGYLDEVRITNGVARYAGTNFTPPNAPYPNPVDIPNAFSFTDQSDVTASTLITSNILQITGLTALASVSISGDGTPQYRICADATCTANPAWTSSAGNIINEQYLQVRLTSGSAGVGRAATVTVGGRSDSWSVISAGVAGYFVLSSVPRSNGNFTSIANADAICLTEVQNTSWLGKTGATLNSTTVRAFLCDSGGCNNLLPSTTYAFARAGSATSGGTTFITDSSGRGPGNTTAWTGATYFDSTATYWTGRATSSSSLWATTQSASHCNNWTATTNGTQGHYGNPNNTDGNRWQFSSTGGCGYSLNYFICIVNPP